MKKSAIVLLAILCVLPLVGQSQEVTSVNAVGFVRLELNKGEFFLACCNFDMLSGDNVITNVLNPNEVPGGTTVYFWDPAEQTYGATEAVSTFGGVRWDPGTNIIAKGVSFWIKVPGSATEDTYELTINGQVPSDTNMLITIESGFTFAANPYPVETLISDTHLSATAAGGDTCYFWRNEWVPESYVTFGGARWDPGTNVFAPGEGVLYKSVSMSSTLWNELKLYEWP